MGLLGGKKIVNLVPEDSPYHKNIAQTANILVNEMNKSIKNDKQIREAIKQQHDLLNDIMNLHISLRKEFKRVLDDNKINIENINSDTQELHEKLQKLEILEKHSIEFTEFSRGILNRIASMEGSLEQVTSKH